MAEVHELRELHMQRREVGIWTSVAGLMVLVGVMWFAFTLTTRSGHTTAAPRHAIYQTLTYTPVSALPPDAP